MILSRLLIQLVFASYFSQPAYVSLEQANSLLSKSVLIRIKSTSEDGKKQLSGCSGTYIAARTVLSAAHCFEGVYTNIWVRDGISRESFTATVKKIDPDLDLALLTINTKKPHAFAAMGSSLAQGSDITVVGSPFGLEFLLSQGIVAKTGFRLPRGIGTFMLHTAMINPGSSGGGVFNKQGQIVGVNTIILGGLFGWAGISGAVDARTIHKFLTQVKPAASLSGCPK